MQAAEKLGIVYIGKAGGKVIFRILSLTFIVIVSWHLYLAVILRNAISRFLRGRLPRLYVRWRKGGFRTQRASSNSKIHFLVFEGLISSKSLNLVSECIAHIYM